MKLTGNFLSLSLFLFQMYKHEHAIQTKSPLPPTVVDQIRLWENERNRFTFTEGFAYNQFLSQGDFVTLRDYAQSIKVWRTEWRFLFVC